MFSTLLQISTTAVTTAADTAIKAVAPAATQPTGVADSFSVFSIIAKGGIIMIPLGLLLLLVIFVLVERLITLSKASKSNPQFMPGISWEFRRSKGNV